MGRTVVIGDIHGCSGEFDALLQQVALGPGDRLVLLGDLVDRGPDSRGMVERARDLSRRLGPRFVFVLGNHEDKHLRYRKGVLSGVPVDSTALPRMDEHKLEVHQAVGPELWDWVGEQARLYCRLDSGLLAIHAGLLDGIPALPDDPAKTDFWSSPRRQKLRAGALHLRRVTERGHFVHLAAPSEGTFFWGERYDGSSGFIVHGHSATAGALREYPFSLGIDTGCVYGYCLTGAIWEGPVDTPRKPDQLVYENAAQAWSEVSGAASASLIDEKKET